MYRQLEVSRFALCTWPSKWVVVQNTSLLQKSLQPRALTGRPIPRHFSKSGSGTCCYSELTKHSAKAQSAARARARYLQHHSRRSIQLSNIPPDLLALALQPLPECQDLQDACLQRHLERAVSFQGKSRQEVREMLIEERTLALRRWEDLFTSRDGASEQQHLLRWLAHEMYDLHLYVVEYS